MARREYQYQGNRYRSSSNTRSDAGSTSYIRSDTQSYGSRGAQDDFYTARPYAADPAYSRDNSYWQLRDEQERVEKKRKRHHRVLAVLIVVVILLCACGGTAYAFKQSVDRVQAEADAVLSAASDYKTQVISGNSDAMASDSQIIADNADAIVEETTSPLWQAASHLPVYGDDVVIAQQLGSTLNDLSDDAITPITDELSGVSLSGLVKSDHSIDVDMLERVINALAAVQEPIDQACASMDSLGTSHFDQVNTAIDKVTTKLDNLDSLVAFANEVAPSATSMLGADGQTKTYLVIAQNNDEIRSTGGFPGSLTVMTVTDGKVSMNDFAALYNSEDFDSVGLKNNPITQTDEEYNLFGVGQADYYGNLGMNPNFPRTAQMFEEYWQRIGGGDLDGVIAIDPTFLQDLLGIVGSVTTSNGTVVDGTNAVRIIEHDAYWNLSTTDQDAFFSEVAELSIQKLFDNLGNASLTKLAQVVEDAGDRSSMLMYFDDTNVESAVSKLGFDGTVTADTDEEELGVYFNDDTWSKMDWYLKANTEVSDPVTNADGSRTYQVTTTLYNMVDTANADSAEDLPAYVYGSNPLRTQNGDMITTVFIYCPAGGYLSNMNINGDVTNDAGTFSITGLQVYKSQIRISPASSCTYTYSVTIPAGSADLTVRQTPTLQDYIGW
jgi:hypothetical protein